MSQRRIRFIPKGYDETTAIEYPKITREMLKLSVLVSTMLDNENDTIDDGDIYIPLPRITDTILPLILEYCIKYESNQMTSIEKPLKTDNLTTVVGSDYSYFIDFDESANKVSDLQDPDYYSQGIRTKEQLFELTNAANYMYMQPLLDLCCAKIACMIKGKTSEEIQETLGIENDFSPEEEEQVNAETQVQ